MKKGFTKFLSVTLALVMAFSVIPHAFAMSGDIDPAIIAETSQTAIQIEGEGIVLLKNEDDVLPLSEGKINVFGAGSVCPFIGGSGSGSVISEDPITFYDALEEQGIEYNNELRELYEEHCGTSVTPKTDNTVLNNLLALIFAKNSLDELDIKKLDDNIIANAKAFSDTAVVVIGRTGSEGTDLTEEILQLKEEEIALFEKLNANFENIIVLFNIANIMEMGWLEDYENIKAAAIIWIPGEFGMSAVAQVLNGKINPSGRLADTVAYKVSDHPSNECFGTNKYDGGKYYVEYLEGIYVGYRYFETFSKDKVQYPFGYGLSYTSFDKEIVDYSTSNEKITVKVKVTNTGKVSGKEAVQIYYSAPYYEGGIEKSAICLGGFAKTQLLAPGKSETVTVQFHADDMASYDYKENEAWVLEKGTYKIILGENVREHIDSFDYVVKKDKIIKTDDVTGTEIENHFEHR